jgi:ABC-type nitrate/sulfonate/bicarbonate transport system ATPase subunit
MLIRAGYGAIDPRPAALRRADQQITTLLVTHDVDEAVLLTDRVVVLLVALRTAAASSPAAARPDRCARRAR